MNNLKLYILSTIIIISLELIYFMFNQDWYKYEINKSQNKPLKIKLSGVIIRYIAQIIGLNIFVLQNKGSPCIGLLYGLIIYSNYLATNYATIDHFDRNLAIVDLIKGGSVMFLTTYFIYKLI